MRAIAALLLACLVAGPALADPLDPLVGSWRAVAVTPAGPGEPPAAPDLTLRLNREGGGFRLQWRVPGTGPLEVTFAPTDRPGVYGAEPGRGSLFGMFAAPAAGDPLKGERLVWARIEGAALVVYSLALEPSGDFALDRSSHLPEAEGIALAFSRLGQGGLRLAFEARLQREGG